jgi:histidine ammonia-lyase
MGTIAARKAAGIIVNVRRVIAIELLCASRGIELRNRRPGAGAARALAALRKSVPSSSGDRALSHDIERAAGLIAEGEFSSILRTLLL